MVDEETIKGKCIGLWDRLNLPLNFIEAQLKIKRQLIKIGTLYFSFHHCLPDNQNQLDLNFSLTHILTRRDRNIEKDPEHSFLQIYSHFPPNQKYLT